MVVSRALKIHFFINHDALKTLFSTHCRDFYLLKDTTVKFRWGKRCLLKNFLCATIKKMYFNDKRVVLLFLRQKIEEVRLEYNRLMSIFYYSSVEAVACIYSI